MNKIPLSKNLYSKGFPAIIGLSIAWIGIRIIRNEEKLLRRHSELKSALAENSSLARRRHLNGK
tara:strand:- start:81 stop:272 length:192 start_codon:yes stop_codon:yes gene_type:complete